MQTRTRMVAALAGLMACGLARHVLGAYTSDPSWIMLAATAVFCIALASGGRPRSAAPFIMGIACGLVLPPALPSSPRSIVTHAPSQSAHQEIFAALEQLDEHPQTLLGHRIGVTGSWTPAHEGTAAAVSRRLMACCAADAVDVGFDVAPARVSVVSAGADVRVSGIVRALLRDGEIRYTLTNATVSALNVRSSAAK